MYYRLFTTTEDRIFEDFFAMIEHMESTYGYLRMEFRGNVYNLYNDQDERIGYYQILP